MSSPTTGPTRARPDVMAYVAGVRAQLDDLDATEVEELTDGLAADLADLAAESDDPLAQRLGPPQAYAEELRAAAGLPSRGQVVRTGEVELLRANLRGMLKRLRSDARWPPVESFLRSIRPAWWVLRAVVAVWLVASVFGGRPGLGSLVLLVAFVVVSVELGRGRWTGRRGLSPLVLAGNALAAVATPFLLGALLMSTDRAGGYSVYEGVGTVPGLVRDGEPVRNVFAFDAKGRPLTDVQLFDQDGRPLAVDPNLAFQEQEVTGTVARSRQLVPAVDVYGRQAWNVFPLRRTEVTTGDDVTGVAPSTAAPTPVAPPLVSAPPLAPLSIPTAAATDLPTDDPALTPTASPTTAPTDVPTDVPTTTPTDAPAPAPTRTPTDEPTTAPTSAATRPGPTPTR